MEITSAVPHSADELITGYTPAFRATSGWRHVFRQTRRAPDGGVVRRVTFDNIDDPHRRILVDVAEFPSPVEAMKRLEASRADANFETSAGPSRFGAESFADDAIPLSLYFCRFNLMIWVFSCGREPVFVSSWAEQILDDLEVKPTAEPGSDLILTTEHDTQTPARPLHLTIKSKWDLGEWAWRKFRATGGTLARSMDTDSLLFWPAAGSKETSVTGWVIEPGRATYAGRFTLSGRSA